MKMKFFIIISTIALIISEYISNAKPTSTTHQQDSECKAKTYDCTDDVHDPDHPAYKDKTYCGSVNKSCTHNGTSIEGYEPRVFKQRFKPGPDEKCLLDGCCCSKPRRSDSSA